MGASIHLVNIAVSAPSVEHAGVAAFLHQKLDSGVHGGKPLPRDPTATTPLHHLGPRLTTFRVPDFGGVFCGKQGQMVNRKLSAADQARSVVHDWCLHSDAALPAFVLPASDSPADRALAEAVLARFAAKAPDAAKAEEFGNAFQVSGRGDKADEAFEYYNRAVGLTPRLWVPGDDGRDLAAADLLLLLAAQNTGEWEEMLSRIQGPINLVVNAGVDAAGTFIDTQYMGLSATATAPVAGDTSLPGEILTAGGGLIPGAVGYSHTAGTSTFVDTKTFTSNGSDLLPVTIAQICLRTASGGGGTMRVREVLSSTATLSASGDALTVTYTLTSSSS